MGRINCLVWPVETSPLQETTIVHCSAASGRESVTAQRLPMKMLGLTSKASDLRTPLKMPAQMSDNVNSSISVAINLLLFQASRHTRPKVA